MELAREQGGQGLLTVCLNVFFVFDAVVLRCSCNGWCRSCSCRCGYVSIGQGRVSLKKWSEVAVEVEARKGSSSEGQVGVNGEGNE